MEENITYLISVMVAYDENSIPFFTQLKTLITEKFPEVEIIGYREDSLKERKKAFGVKGSWAARVTPFAVMCDYEKNPLKAFYSEVQECTVDNIEFYLDSYLKQLKVKVNENSSN